MKIEKISDTQIKCTLNRSDLVSRELKISELAYGTEKAKDLFHDMIEQASNEFGFEADEVPLMIEAIPISSDCIVLIITKVDNPDELDARFAKYAPDEDDSPVAETMEGFSTDDEIMDLDNIFKAANEVVNNPQPDNFIPMSETITAKAEPAIAPDKLPQATEASITKIFSFVTWDDVSNATVNLNKSMDIDSKLFKSDTGIYYLALTVPQKDKDEFTKTCNLLSEYGRKENTNYATLPYLSEHCRLIIKKDALRVLSEF